MPVMPPIMPPIMPKIRFRRLKLRPRVGLSAPVQHGRGWRWSGVGWELLAAIVLIVGLLLHAMFGANGMVIYRQKRGELQALRNEVERLQKENGEHVDQIKALKTDPAAIEKEAREQLHYTRPGEVILVSPEPPQKPSPPTSRAQKDVSK
jgi:cell division protein FtsB